MSSSPQILATVLLAAKAAGLDQKGLAVAAGLAPETVSRAKRRPSSIDLQTLEALAGAAGLTLTVRPTPSQGGNAKGARTSLADPKWGLAWSNPDAGPEALVSNALLRGGFSAILEAVLDYGLAFVRAQWKVICSTPETAPKPKLRGFVSDMLDNISVGLARAAT